MTMHIACDGVKRREFLRWGSLGIGGLTLSNYLGLAQAGMVAQSRATSAIFIELDGGPSHLDTFDLKPDAEKEFRGEFNPIATNVPGIMICEHLPKIAQCADKLAILRGVSHTLAAHDLGKEYVNTGNRPIPSLEFPGFGSVVSKERPSAKDMPSFVAIPRTTQRAGYLGVRYSPLSTLSVPQVGKPFAVRGLALTGAATLEKIGQRQKLLNDLDSQFELTGHQTSLLDGMDQFSQQAYDMISSPKARKAFDISKEDPSFAQPFGEDSFGQSCLLALRLVESGVRFVTTSLGGWDTHQDNFGRLKNALLPKLDTGLSALLNGLEQRGLLATTAVVVTGEFGRTPKINSKTELAGRDHYPRCMFMLMAGGAVKGGQVIGESDAKAAGPKGDGFSPDDVAASLFYNLGIDPELEYLTETGRPITLVRNGKIIPQLFG